MFSIKVNIRTALFDSYSVRLENHWGDEWSTSVVSGLLVNITQQINVTKLFDRNGLYRTKHMATILTLPEIQDSYDWTYATVGDLLFESEVDDNDDGVTTRGTCRQQSHQDDLSIHTDPDLLHSFRILCLSIGLTMANFTFAS